MFKTFYQTIKKSIFLQSNEHTSLIFSCVIPPLYGTNSRACTVEVVSYIFPGWSKQHSAIVLSESNTYYDDSTPHSLTPCLWHQCYLSQGAFTRSDKPLVTGHKCWEWYCPIPQQKDHTVFRGAMSVESFCCTRAVLPTTFISGNKWFIPDRVNAPKVNFSFEIIAEW